jgi:hypothetical protein
MTNEGDAPFHSIICRQKLLITNSNEVLLTFSDFYLAKDSPWPAGSGPPGVASAGAFCCLPPFVSSNAAENVLERTLFLLSGAV